MNNRLSYFEYFSSLPSDVFQRMALANRLMSSDANPTHACSDVPRGITQTAKKSVTRMGDKNPNKQETSLTQMPNWRIRPLVEEIERQQSPRHANCLAKSRCARHEWPLVTPHCRIHDDVHAANSVLRAHAAQKWDDCLGLVPDVRCGTASDIGVGHLPYRIGPKPPSAEDIRCCGAAHRTSRSLQSQNHKTVEFTRWGTDPPFALAATADAENARGRGMIFAVKRQVS